jgi:hypothetical protein
MKLNFVFIDYGFSRPLLSFNSRFLPNPFYLFWPTSLPTIIFFSHIVNTFPFQRTASLLGEPSLCLFFFSIQEPPHLRGELKEGVAQKELKANSIHKYCKFSISGANSRGEL